MTVHVEFNVDMDTDRSQQNMWLLTDSMISSGQSQAGTWVDARNLEFVATIAGFLSPLLEIEYLGEAAEGFGCFSAEGVELEPVEFNDPPECT